MCLAVGCLDILGFWKDSRSSGTESLVPAQDDPAHQTQAHQNQTYQGQAQQDQATQGQATRDPHPGAWSGYNQRTSLSTIAEEPDDDKYWRLEDELQMFPLES